MDVQKFEAYFVDFRVEFMPFATKRVGDDLAEDAMLETYLRLRRLLPKYEERYGRKGTFGWMLAVHSRVCAEIRRHEARHDHSEMPEVVASAQPGIDEGVIDQAECDEEAAWLQYLMGSVSLSPIQRAILTAYSSGEKTEETAFRLSMTEANVRANLSAAVRKLQEAAGADIYDFMGA